MADVFKKNQKQGNLMPSKPSRSSRGCSSNRSTQEQSSELNAEALRECQETARPTLRRSFTLSVTSSASRSDDSSPQLISTKTGRFVRRGLFDENHPSNRDLVDANHEQSSLKCK